MTEMLQMVKAFVAGVAQVFGIHSREWCVTQTKKGSALPHSRCQLGLSRCFYVKIAII
ncbi:MAG: hypothetical protein RI964_260 [Pseudomonadota bacterium]|jgi:hypothetical protein